MLDEILRQALRTSDTGVTPGGVLAYGDQGQHVATLPFGRSHIQPAHSVVSVTENTIYDIASLTKPMATAAALMTLDVDLDAPVQPWVPELAGARRITLAHLLGHGSGLPAHVRFYERLLAGDLAGKTTPRSALFAMACAAALEAEPGERAVYSDLGYIVLGRVIERITGKRLDQVVRERVTGPLAMRETFFVEVGAEPPVARSRIAPTEVCPYRGLVHGEVHDDNAHAGGGIHGHAGLFSTAGDVARFARAMVLALNGQRAGLLSPEVVRRFTGRQAAPGATWRLGWDRPAPLPSMSHAGDLWPRDGMGHLGFTGCSLWLDPPRGRYVVLLTNRVHPSRDQPGILELRRAVMDAVVRALDAR